MYRGYQANNIGEPRERSRDRDRSSKDNNYYESTNNNNMGYDNYGRPYTMTTNINLANSQLANKKRVKFEDAQDIRVFKKEDQPAAKGLTEDEILQVKLKFQKQIAKTYDYNWDQKKHFDALSEQNSIKEQKEKQKQMYEKLMSMKEQIQFYMPQALDLPEQVIISNQVQASDSIEKEAHAQRISEVLGCYYTTVNEIPNQPTFEVTTANNKNQSKIIKFHPAGINQSQQFMSKTIKNEKALKGILKITNQKKGPSVSETRASFSKIQPPRQINPRLIFFLKDMQMNKAKYSKELSESILKPFKQSGELEYLLKNQNLLNQLLKAPTTFNPGSNTNMNMPNNPPISNNPSQYNNTGMYNQNISIQNPQEVMQNRSSISPSPHNQLKPYFSSNLQNKGSIGHRNDKFKTVPCKYYHSHQGCVKTQNCTFIHDERYAGVPTPSMSNYIPTMGMTPGNNPSFTPSQQPQITSYNSYSGNGSQQVNNQYNPNFSQKQYIPPQSSHNNNPNNMGYQPSTYQSGYGSQNYQNQSYNTSNPQQQGYQQNNQGYYSQSYMNKGPAITSPYGTGQYGQGQYGMQGNQNNQYRGNNNLNQNQNNNQGNNQ